MHKDEFQVLMLGFQEVSRDAPLVLVAKTKSNRSSLQLIWIERGARSKQKRWDKLVFQVTTYGEHL